MPAAGNEAAIIEGTAAYSSAASCGTRVAAALAKARGLAKGDR